MCNGKNRDWNYIVETETKLRIVRGFGGVYFIFFYFFRRSEREREPTDKSLIVIIKVEHETGKNENFVV